MNSRLITTRIGRDGSLLLITALFMLNLHFFSTALAQGVECSDLLVEEADDNTSIIFQLPEDVEQTKKPFSVYFSKGMRMNDWEKILDCWWPLGKLHCNSWPVYKYQLMPGKLLLKIPKAFVELTGTYKGQISDTDHRNTRPCNFTVRPVGRTWCDIPSVSKTSKTSLTCFFPEDVFKAKHSFDVNHYDKNDKKRTILSCELKEGKDFGCQKQKYMKHSSDVIYDSVGYNFTVAITSVLESYEGAYSCNIKGSESSRRCFFALKKEATSSCTDVSVKVKEPTTLTCTFSYDISLSRRNFKVVHTSHRDNKGYDILICVWINDHLTCNTSPGYEFNNVVTNFLVVNIPQASHDHNGTVVCHVLGSDVKGFSECHFLIEDEQNSTSFPQCAIWVSAMLFIVFLGTAFLIILIWRQKIPLDTFPFNEIPLNVILFVIIKFMLWIHLIQRPDLWGFSKTNDQKKLLPDEKSGGANRAKGPSSFWPDLLRHKETSDKIELSEHQASLLKHYKRPTFLTGLPGTGKTVMLLRVATKWLLHGHHVYIVSTWEGSDTACMMLFYLLQQTIKTELSGYVLPCKLHFLKFYSKDVTEATMKLQKAAKKRLVCVITDESEIESNFFKCGLVWNASYRLWAAGCKRPTEIPFMEETILTEPFRTPKHVIMKTKDEWPKQFLGNLNFDSNDKKFPLKNHFNHEVQNNSNDKIAKCSKCIGQVKKFLRDLQAMLKDGGTKSSLNWSDVLVVHGGNAADSKHIVDLLNIKDIEVCPMTVNDINDVFTAQTNVLWVANENLVLGLERRFIICLEGSRDSKPARRKLMCSKELMIVSHHF